MSRINKLRGSTPSEALLESFCERTFLGLWSYPRPFRDQGVTSANRQGKELADLIVIFGDDLIIFSDKSCAFPSTNDINVAWTRWLRKAVLKSADQALGAERWLRNHPNRVFLDPNCQERFPFPISTKSRIHKILVATGASERLRATQGGSGSLASIFLPTTEPLPPFCLDMTPYGSNTHVYNEVSLPIILKELDTAFDFIQFLNWKERLIQEKILGFVAGEEELLGLYEASYRGREPDALPPMSSEQPLAVCEGMWAEYENSPLRQLRHAAESLSYAWDSIISEWGTATLEGNMEFGNEDGAAGHEERIRPLAKTSRLARVELVRAWGELQGKQQAYEAQSRTIIFSEELPKTVFVITVFPDDDYEDIPAYRMARADWLVQYAMATMKRHPEADEVSAIAVAGRRSKWGHSEDIILIRRSHWTAAEEEAANQIEDELAELRSPGMKGPPQMGGEEREPLRVHPEAPCPCRGGRKYRKCHAKVESFKGETRPLWAKWTGDKGESRPGTTRDSE